MFRRAVLPFSFAVLAQAVFVFLYLGHERAINFWDYAMYSNMAVRLWAQGGWADFAQSFAQKYNLLFALPSLISFSLLGTSRTVFIVTNMIVYGAAYQLAAGFLLRRLYGLSWQAALLAAAGICCLVPFLWYPLLEGYPDHGAAALLLAAMALACEKEKSAKNALVLGLLVGLSIVFRRHYAYAGLAVLAAGAVVDFPQWKKKSFWQTHALRGIAALAALMMIEPSYLQEMLTADYKTLYQSYERPAPYFFHFAAAHGGTLLLVTAGAGWFLAWRKSLVEKRGAAFILLSVLLWLLLWGFGPSQAGQHYLIALLPLFFIVGLAGLFVALKKERVVFWMTLMLLASNAAFCFWLAPRFVLPSEPPAFSVFGTPRAPWVRHDNDALIALAQVVAKTTTDGDTIVVSGSSFLFNQDLVRALYTDVLREAAPAYRFIPAPESDGDQPPPLDVYAAANVYLVATPAQFHLDPARQKNVAALAAMFPPPPALTPFFTKDEKTFLLDGGVSISIWRRSPWTPQMLHEGLKTIRATTPSPQPWVLEKAGAHFFPLPSVSPFSAFQLALTPQKPLARLFLDEPLDKGAYRLGLTLEKSAGCPALSVRALLRDPVGGSEKEQSSLLPNSPSLFFFPFDVGSSGSFLSIEVKSPTTNVCWAALRDVFVEKTFR
ncbi:MAG: hypothetical protein WC612_01890 [Bdellovibrionales bacterium]|jgi:hypothetical protein